MKKIFILATTMVAMMSCEKLSLDMPDSVDSNNATQSTQDSQSSKKVKNFTFTIKGDFESPTFSRAYLQADNKDMTDLWVFDYMNGVCVQTYHQSPSDEDWGVPQMPLEYGNHHVYFVASRGTTPTLDAERHTISWEIPSDTFWEDYSVDVTSTSNGNRAVTLKRVATKLVVFVKDSAPVGITDISIIPETWYHGVDYMTGEATDQKTKHERTASVGHSSYSFFGISGKSEWKTNVDIVTKDNTGKTVRTVTIEDAPFKQNRSTEYTGNLFIQNNDWSFEMQDWDESVTGSF